MAGGFKQFGPTYNSTPYVRLGYEGILNGTHKIDVTAAQNVNGELAGKFAMIDANGVAPANSPDRAVGLFREDLGDMINASERATFYFRGGEYYVNVKRTAYANGTLPAGLVVGAEITCDSEGRLKLKENNEKALGVVTHVGLYRAGNMYENATKGVTDTDTFIGFIMFI